MSTAKTLMKGASSRIVAQFIAALSSMILLPIIVSKLGDRMYGAWVVVGSVVGYYGVLDLGLSSAISRFVSREIGRDNIEDADSYIAASFFLYCIGGILAFCVTIAASILCGYFLEKPDEIHMFRCVLLIVGAALAITFPSRCFEGILISHLRYDIIGYVTMFCVLLRAVLIFTVLSYGGKLISIAIVSSGFTVTRAFLYMFYARNVHGKLPLRISLVNREKIFELYRYAIMTFIAQIADLIRFNLAPLIISYFLGLESVTPYAIAFRLRKLISQVSVSLLSIMAPVFSRQEARQDTYAIQWSYLFIYKISCYIGVLMIGSLAILGSPFIQRWIGEGSPLIVKLLNIGLIGSLFTVIQIPTINLLYGISKNKHYAVCNILHAALGFTLSVILIRPYGLMGVVIGEVTADTVVKTLLLPWLGSKSINISLGAYHLKHTLPNICLPALIILVSYALVRPFIAASYFDIFLQASVITVVYSIIVFYLGFSKRQRTLLLNSVGISRN